MLEILFRGKRFDNGKWVEGGYIPLDVDSGYTYIIEPCIYASTFSALDLIKLHLILVIPETVGQYTGLTDKNGVKIFEGDILAANFDEDFPENLTIVEVVWNEYGWCTKEGSAVPDAFDDSDGDLFEIIGNIHDNPELLGTAAKTIDKNIAQSGLAPATENFELMEG